MIININKLLIIACLIILYGCNTLFTKPTEHQTEETEKELLYKKDPIGNYGQNISLKETLDLDIILKSVDIYQDKEVLISGEIIEVCPMRGCWIDVKQNHSDIKIRVKVTDGKIVFPLSSKGKHIKVQGKLDKIIFTEETARKWKIHLAKEQGKYLSPDSIIIEESDLFEYRINGKSAVIY